MLDEAGNGTRDAATGKETDSKNKVFEAYDELLQKLKATTKTPTAIKQEEQVVAEKKVVVETAAKETADELAKHLTNLKNSLNHALDDIEVKLNTEKKKFETLQQAIAIQSKELNDLYEIKPQADTLAALVMAYNEKSITLEQEITQRKQQWQKEQVIRDEGRIREEDSFNYNRELFRRKEQEEYDAQKRRLEQELNDRQVKQDEFHKAREAELAVRVAKVAARELEFQQLQEEVRTFPDRIQQAIDEAERVQAEKLAIKFEYEAKLLHKDFDVERQVHAQTVSTLEARIEHLESLNYSFKPFAYNPNTASATKETSEV